VAKEDGCDEHVRWATREWPEIDGLVEGIATRVEVATRQLDRSARDTLDEIGLSHGELKVLLRLIRGERAHGDIARELMVSTGTMTNRVDKLEKGGLVQRQPDPKDRRGVLLQLTDAGRTVLDRYISVQADRERRLMSHLSAAEREALNDLLRKLLASIASELRPGPEPARS
jgi:DNA-binding MarR family transcriptional regulator